MQEYDSFADVYDLFMNEIPYEKWVKYIVSLLKEEGIDSGLVLELGCGTGTVTEMLSDYGYDMTGIDMSSEMLQKALEKRDESKRDILYLNQDMREFELYGTMRAIISVCDTMNYLTDPDDFLQTLKLVNNYLDPSGIFIFDLKTEHYFRDVLGERTEAVNEEEASYIWENFYDEETKVNEYQLTLFEKESDDLFKRTFEYHEQRSYDIDEIKELAEKAGLIFVGAFKECTKVTANGSEDRIHVILREHGKEVI